MQLVLCDCPSESAMAVAQSVVDASAAAHVDVVSKGHRFYRSGDGVVAEENSMLVIHTLEERVQTLVDALVVAHPAEDPPIVILPLVNGSPDFVEWVEDEWGTNGERKDV